MAIKNKFIPESAISGKIIDNMTSEQNFTDSQKEQARTNINAASEEYVDEKIAELVNGAPETLNTIGELANALDNKITTPSTATVGQVLIVKAVEENGKPTEWETVDKFTEADKTEIKALIKAYVDEAILGGTW